MHTCQGEQKKNLNKDKQKYLKLTFEQIQELAMKQKSGKFFFEEICPKKLKPSFSAQIARIFIFKFCHWRV